MTLISEAKEEVIIVSPYVNITSWTKMTRCLKMAVDKGVQIKIYVRKGASNDYKPFLDFGIQIIHIENLHAKIYLNESHGIVSSQNLYEYSDVNSIDFGYRTEDRKEWIELYQLIANYLDGKKEYSLKKVVESINVVAEPVSPILSENVKLSPAQIHLIAESLREELLAIKIVDTATYVYLKEIFPFGDVMLREGFEIRLKSLTANSKNEILEMLQNLSFEGCHYKFKKKVIDKRAGICVMLTPQNPTNLAHLTEDYTRLAKSIFQQSRSIDVELLYM